MRIVSLRFTLFAISVSLTAVGYASPANVSFNGQQLTKSPESREPRVVIYRSPSGKPEITEVGVTSIEGAATDWLSSKDALLRVLKRKQTILPLTIRSADTDDYVLADFAVERPDLHCIEYVILKHYPNSKGELISIDARIRSSSPTEKVVPELRQKRERSLQEFSALTTALGV